MKGDRIGEVKYNNQGSLMKIIKDNGVYDIIVEFQDKYKAKVKCRYCNFRLRLTCVVPSRFSLVALIF